MDNRMTALVASTLEEVGAKLENVSRSKNEGDPTHFFWITTSNGEGRVLSFDPKFRLSQWTKDGLALLKEEIQFLAY
jgi:hypothetical protein